MLGVNCRTCYISGIWIRGKGTSEERLWSVAVSLHEYKQVQKYSMAGEEGKRDECWVDA